MRYFLLTESGVWEVRNDITITARQAVSQGNLVVNEDGHPVEPPLPFHCNKIRPWKIDG